LLLKPYETLVEATTAGSEQNKAWVEENEAKVEKNETILEQMNTVVEQNQTLVSQSRPPILPRVRLLNGASCDQNPENSGFVPSVVRGVYKGTIYAQILFIRVSWRGVFGEFRLCAVRDSENSGFVA